MTRRVNLMIDNSLYDDIVCRADMAGLSVSAFIRDTLAEAMSHAERRPEAHLVAESAYVADAATTIRKAICDGVLKFSDESNQPGDIVMVHDQDEGALSLYSVEIVRSGSDSNIVVGAFPKGCVSIKVGYFDKPSGMPDVIVIYDNENKQSLSMIGTKY